MEGTYAEGDIGRLPMDQGEAPAFEGLELHPHGNDGVIYDVDDYIQLSRLFVHA